MGTAAEPSQKERVEPDICTAAYRSFRLQKRASTEGLNRKLSQPLQNAISGSSKRSLSALAQYQPHKLSEIPEVSASSRASLARRYSSSYVNVQEAVDGTNELDKEGTKFNSPDFENGTRSSSSASSSNRKGLRPVSLRSDLRSLASSALSLPLHEIPKRRSSMTALRTSFPKSRRASVQDIRSETASTQNIISQQGQAQSPVRHAIERGAQSSAVARTSSSCTFIRTATPYYLLEDDYVRNPRLDMSVRLPSPLFVGGGTVEGQIELKVDLTSSKKTRSKPLYISRLAVDVIGVEEVEDGRRRIFLSLATELFDYQRPPPSTLVRSQIPEKGSEVYWETKPATVTVPFCVNLPLKLGPPPYSSRQASIRYLLLPSAVIKVGEKRSAVRQTWNIQMLTIHDPERALSSLPSPLLATDTLIIDHSPALSSVKLTAGLHRQTWVSGGKIFTDIHVVNNTEKNLKRIELQLEKSLLWFSHSIAGTAEKRAKNLRLPSKIETEVVCMTRIKKTKEWNGISPGASEVRTCELDIPKGQVTIGDGRYFEVRYFIRTAVFVSRNKTVSVKLPVTIIPINSLDILPNSVAQVAASIEAKRTMAIAAICDGIARIPHSQGQAFSAARRQTSHRVKRPAETMTSDDIIALAQTLDHSPRRAEHTFDAELHKKVNIEPELVKENMRLGPSPCYRHPTLCSSCYHCHLLYTAYAARMSERSGPKLPRLQVSTSGLGFSESEFEIPPETPRKVMLSESERQMINQQRELRLQRQSNQQKSGDLSRNERLETRGAEFLGWKNVAAQPDPAPYGSTDSAVGGRLVPERRLSQRPNSFARAQRSSLSSAIPRRNQSRIRSERMRANFSDSGLSDIEAGRPARGMRNIERGDKYPWCGYNFTEDDVFGPDKIDRSGPW